MKAVGLRYYLLFLVIIIALGNGFLAAAFMRKATLLDTKSSLSRDIEVVLQRVKDSQAQGLSIFELGEYANLFLSEKAHELVYRVYQEVGREPQLISIGDPAFKIAYKLLQESFMGRLRPKQQSARDILQALNDVIDNDQRAIVDAIRASLNISALKDEKLEYLSKLEDAQQQVESLKAKISDLQKETAQAPEQPKGAAKAKK